MNIFKKLMAALKNKCTYKIKDARSLYAVYASNNIDCNNLDKYYDKEILTLYKDIEYTASMGKLYKLYEFPYWFLEEHKKQAITEIHDRGMFVDHYSNSYMVITWKLL